MNVLKLQQESISIILESNLLDKIKLFQTVFEVFQSYAIEVVASLAEV